MTSSAIIYTSSNNGFLTPPVGFIPRRMGAIARRASDEAIGAELFVSPVFFAQVGKPALPNTYHFYYLGIVSH